MKKQALWAALAVCLAAAAALTGAAFGRAESRRGMEAIEALRVELAEARRTLDEQARTLEEAEQAAAGLESELRTLETENAALRRDAASAAEALAALEADAYGARLRRSVAENHTFTLHSHDTAGITGFQYLLYAPNGLDAAEAHPMIVYLHGIDAVGTNVERIYAENSLPSFLRDGQLCPNALVLIPQCPSENWYEHRADLMELIEYAAEAYNADRGRISITGFSLGGIGCFAMLTEYPDVFSAAAPFAATYPPGACGVITSTPVRMIHGSEDTGMGFDVVQINAIIRRAGGESELILYSGEGHNVQKHYLDDGGKLLDWLISHRR